LDAGGSITTDELKEVLPPGLDEAAIDTILNAADHNNDGTIDMAEFKSLIFGPVCQFYFVCWWFDFDVIEFN
jgi:Ca2+-binding EF-hand superfamily protein